MARNLRGLDGRSASLRDRYAAWQAAGAVTVTGLAGTPEPRSIGEPAVARRLLEGCLRMGGHALDLPVPEASPWGIPHPAPAFTAALHGFGWLDDLAALGDDAARRMAQGWLDDWLARFGSGNGPGWVADLAGRRLIRWVHHAPFVLGARPGQRAGAFLAALGRHAGFLARRSHDAPSGLPRIEALTGLLYAGLALEGAPQLGHPARIALAQEAAFCIDGEGGIASRNPEELLEIFANLVWAAQQLAAAGLDPAPGHAEAVARAATVLRSLRRGDGALACFHGGGPGSEGKLERALAASGTRPSARAETAMGFARLAAGRCTVIVDAATPPAGAASRRAHASSLAFEMCSGRRPLVVNCGAGQITGESRARSMRATAMHSTLSIEGFSSARLGAAGLVRGGTDRTLLHRPARVILRHEPLPGGGGGLVLSHDGYVATHGLVHVRRLELSGDGRALTGEDSLVAMEPAHRARFARMRDLSGRRGLSAAVRFHLHPDVAVDLDPAERAVRLILRSGEDWVFRAEGATLALEPSVLLEPGANRPRPTQQIVLAFVQTETAHPVAWTLAKARGTPLAVRDAEAMAADAAAPAVPDYQPAAP